MKTYGHGVMKKLISKLAAITLLLSGGVASAAGPTFDGMTVDGSGTISGCPTGNESDCTTLQTESGFLQQEVTVNDVVYIQTVVVDTPTAANGSVSVSWVAHSPEEAANFGNPDSTPLTSTPYVILDKPEITIIATGPVTSIDPAILGGYRVIRRGQDGNEETILTTSASVTDGAANFGAFPPGTHQLSWLIPAQNGIETAISVTQNLHVKPLVSFGPAAVIQANEGSKVTLPVYLNGEAFQYPVTVEYSVSGSASYPGDHNAVAGTVTIESGIIGEIIVDIVNDGTSNELHEEVVFTLHTPNNAGLGLNSTQRIIITEATHLPPQLDLTVEQFGRETSFIGNSFFEVMPPPPVTVTVVTQAFNAVNNYNIDWTETDSTLIALGIIDNNRLTFEPYGIPKGIYKISVLLTDLNDPENRNYHLEKFINISEVFAPNIHSDQDNTFQNHTFTLQNGSTINWPRPGNGLTFFWASTLEKDTSKTPVLTPGLKLSSGSITIAMGKSGYRITTNDIKAHGNLNAGPVLYPVDDDLVPSQIVDFEISGLVTPGQSVSIVIPQDTPIPENAVYRKYMPHAGWITFTEDTNNSLASARKVNGICLQPDNAVYTPGLTAGDDCIQLRIEDGGPNDADRQANTIIKDPGGVASMATSATATTSAASTDNGSEGSGGGGSGLNLLWLLAILCAIRCRPKADQIVIVR